MAGPTEEVSDPVACFRALQRANAGYVKLKQAADGHVVELRLSWKCCNGSNLAAAAKIQGLQKLTLQTGEPDVPGIRSLAANPTLSSLEFLCFSYASNGLPVGLLSAASDLPNVRRLVLYYSDAPGSEYTALGSMSNLTELFIVASSNFTDAHFYSLTNAPALQFVDIQSSELTPQSTKMLNQFRLLTNAFLRSETWRTNWHRNATNTASGGVK
jgi:hypothetical protein